MKKKKRRKNPSLPQANNNNNNNNNNNKNLKKIPDHHVRNISLDFNDIPEVVGVFEDGTNPLSLSLSLSLAKGFRGEAKIVENQVGPRVWVEFA